MKINPAFLSEEGAAFEPSIRSRREAVRDPEHGEPQGRPKPDAPARSSTKGGEVVGTFGTADLVRHDDGHWELRGGSPEERAEARAYCSLFQHDATFAENAEPSATDQTKRPNGFHTRVLIADDDALVRGSLAAVLESEGYVVDEAQNGIEAVTRAIEHTPDVVLLDLNMPHWDGWRAFSRLDRVTPLLPVIVITARPHQYPKAVELGVDAFMEKPLNIHVLMRAIKQLTSEGKSRHERRITNRGFVTQLLNGSKS